MILSITSLGGLRFDFSESSSGHIQRSVFEVLPGESFAFRGAGADPIQRVTRDGEDLERQGSDYTFTPPNAGKHRLDLEFTSGRHYSLSLLALDESVLRRIRVGGAADRKAFLSQARLVLRSMARHGEVTDDGRLAEKANPQSHGSAPYGVQLKDLA